MPHWELLDLSSWMVQNVTGKVVIMNSVEGHSLTYMSEPFGQVRSNVCYD